MIVFCDLDGTVADNSHRKGFIEGGKKDWNAFYNTDLIARDYPISASIRVLSRMMAQPGLLIYFLTGRPEKTRQVTMEWLRAYLSNENVHTFPALLMRPDGDYRKAHIYKEEHIQKVRAVFPTKPMVFIDDDVRNIEMYKCHGIMLLAPDCWGHIL